MEKFLNNLYWRLHNFAHIGRLKNLVVEPNFFSFEERDGTKWSFDFEVLDDKIKIIDDYSSERKTRIIGSLNKFLYHLIARD